MYYSARIARNIVYCDTDYTLHGYRFYINFILATLSLKSVKWYIMRIIKGFFNHQSDKLNMTDLLGLVFTINY